MYTQRRLAIAAAIFSMTAAVCSAQSVTSAHSGTLHYFDGSVSIDGAAVVAKVGKFSEIKENSVLSTGQGRAEILLTPGVFLRVGENTQIKMLDNRLLSTRVEFLSGSAIVESDDPEVSVKDPAVTIVYKDYQLQPLKYGVFEINSDPSQMKVFKGQAAVTAGTNRTVVKEGHLVPFSAALTAEKFDEKQGDDLFLWTRDRSSYLSAANMSSARSLASNGYSMDNLFAGGLYPGLGFNSRFQGGWYLNQSMNMYTYMPYDGLGFSPFGYGLFSPGTIYSYYNPSNFYWNGGGGARTGSSSGTVLTSSSSLRNQISRIGSVHPTFSAPTRAAFEGTAMAPRGGSNNSNSNNSEGLSSRGGFSGASAGGAPVMSAAPAGRSASVAAAAVSRGR